MLHSLLISGWRCDFPSLNLFFFQHVPSLTPFFPYTSFCPLVYTSTASFPPHPFPYTHGSTGWGTWGSAEAPLESCKSKFFSGKSLVFRTTTIQGYNYIFNTFLCFALRSQIVLLTLRRYSLQKMPSAVPLQRRNLHLSRDVINKYIIVISL